MFSWISTFLTDFSHKCLIAESSCMNWNCDCATEPFPHVFSPSATPAAFNAFWGGRSTICLGEYPEVKQLVPPVVPPGPKLEHVGAKQKNSFWMIRFSTPSSGLCWISMIIYDSSMPILSSAVLIRMPGGKSSICLGLDGKEAAPVSSNAFACGNNQNCGNVLTNRPTTLLHAPPGGRSTIRLGHDPAEAAEGKSSKSEPRPVGGEDHLSHWGEVPLRTTGHRVPAGGKSTICLGVENENVTESPAVAEASQLESTAEVADEAPLTRRVPAGGTSTVCLGTDISSHLSRLGHLWSYLWSYCVLLGSMDSVRGYGLCACAVLAFCVDCLRVLTIAYDCLRCLGEWILSSRALGHSGTNHEAGRPFDAVVMVNSGRIPMFKTNESYQYHQSTAQRRRAKRKPSRKRNPRKSDESLILLWIPYLLASWNQTWKDRERSWIANFCLDVRTSLRRKRAWWRLKRTPTNQRYAVVWKPILNGIWRLFSFFCRAHVGYQWISES